MDVLCWEIFELRDVGLDEVAFHVHLFANCARIVAFNLVAEESTARALHPAGAGDWKLKVKHELLEELLPVNPRDPKVAASQKHSNALAGKEVSPPLLTNLTKDSINPRIASLTIPPCLEILGNTVPRQLNACRIALHHIKVGIGEARQKSKLTPSSVRAASALRLGSMWKQTV